MAIPYTALEPYLPKAETAMSKLKPCPFCGSEDVAMLNPEYDLFWCQCNDCIAETNVGDTDDEALDKWNKRAATQQVEIESLRGDAERLDYIEKHAICDPKMDGKHTWWPTTFKHRLIGPTIRAAIDAAITNSTTAG